jgi:hypothetical protein
LHVIKTCPQLMNKASGGAEASPLVDIPLGERLSFRVA